MIYSKLEKTIIIDELTHFEYILYLNHLIIGEYQLTIENNKIILSLYKINKDYRKKGYGKEGLKEVEKNIYNLKNDFDIDIFELDATGFDKPYLSSNELVDFYNKYLRVSVIFASKEEIIMSKNI